MQGKNGFLSCSIGRMAVFGRSGAFPTGADCAKRESPGVDAALDRAAAGGGYSIFLPRENPGTNRTGAWDCTAYGFADDFYGVETDEERDRISFLWNSKRISDGTVRGKGDALCVEKLRTVVQELPEADAYLLYLLFFEEVTVKEAAQLCGCSRKTIANRRKRILLELNRKLKELGIMGGCF